MIYRLNGVEPAIADDAWVAPGAHVIGNVRMAAGTSVWFGAVLRGDNEPIVIGTGSNVQDCAVLHTDPGAPLTLGRNVSVGHQATLHGCTIEDDVLVGMGATVMNGAVIGAGSLVAANALVTEGKVFPPRSLIVGAPAKLMRTLDEAAVDGLRDNAVHYRDKAREFAAGLVAIEPVRAQE